MSDIKIVNFVPHPSRDMTPEDVAILSDFAGHCSSTPEPSRVLFSLEYKRDGVSGSFAAANPAEFVVGMVEELGKEREWVRLGLRPEIDQITIVAYGRKQHAWFSIVRLPGDVVPTEESVAAWFVDAVETINDLINW